MNMRYTVTFLSVIALAIAIPVKHQKEEDNGDIKIVRQEQEVELDGRYRYAYETGNGIVLEESGGLVPDAEGNLAQHSEGQFVYTSPEGEVISETYTAGVEGFVPQGDHLPVGPAASDITIELVQLLLSLPPFVDPYFSQSNVGKTVTITQIKNSGKKPKGQRRPQE